MNQKKRLDIIAGARPNFMKIAPIIHEIHKRKDLPFTYRLVHTGQHYDTKMSQQFFDELNIPKPDVNLESGSGTQAEQTSRIMLRYEDLLLKFPAHCCLVVGDVTSTLACSITAKKLNLQVAHVEAGIRSGDLTMPEEINRMVTDSITDYFFTTSATANDQLRKNGAKKEHIYFVGNTMIDTLMANLPRLKKPGLWDQIQLKNQGYIVLTMHRPANVDEEYILHDSLYEICHTSHHSPVIFPVHPRTVQTLKKLDIKFPNLYLVEPLGYLEFIYLIKNAKGVITDSGGITEEATVLGIPCMTLRDSTERPETISMGTNELVGTDPEAIRPHLTQLMNGEWKKGTVPELWDGKTAGRIVDHLAALAGEWK
jgi:UDP-N-acetylglucosamine 2-epimerase (non-hydrolysing)